MHNFFTAFLFISAASCHAVQSASLFGVGGEMRRRYPNGPDYVYDLDPRDYQQTFQVQNRFGAGPQLTNTRPQDTAWMFQDNLKVQNRFGTRRGQSPPSRRRPAPPTRPNPNRRFQAIFFPSTDFSSSSNSINADFFPARPAFMQ